MIQEVSKGLETAMIVMGLAAGSIATLICLVWTCVIYKSSRRKDFFKNIQRQHQQQRDKILPTTNTDKKNDTTPSQEEVASKHNAALLAALVAIQNEAVRLPPPTCLVPSWKATSTSISRSDECQLTQPKKRKHDETNNIKVEPEEEESLDKNAHLSLAGSNISTEHTNDVDSTAAATSSVSPTHRRQGKIRKFVVKMSCSPASKTKAKKNNTTADPFSHYDKQYETAFVQRELHDAADTTARWKICARAQSKNSSSNKNDNSNKSRNAGTVCCDYSSISSHSRSSSDYPLDEV